MATPTLDQDTKFLRFTWISTCAITRAKAVFVPSCKDLEKVANVGIPLCTAVEVCDFMHASLNYYSYNNRWAFKNQTSPIIGTTSNV